MKQFAIAINSEKEYNKVKEYSEKWGYKERDDRGYDEKRVFVWFEDNVFNPCHSVDIDKINKGNWRKAIRKHSPLKLENICVRIDTVERVKEVWGIIKDCGIPVLETTKNRLKTSSVCHEFKHVHYNTYYGNICGIEQYQIDEQNKTEITPKQLAQIFGVKRKDKEVSNGWSVYKDDLSDSKGTIKGECIWEDRTITPKTTEQAVTEFLIYQISQVNKRIDKIAKNYKILKNTEDLVKRKELKAVNGKLRKRLYDLENKVSNQEVEYK